jgi:hypothetical protein
MISSGEPHFAMRGDVFERAVEISDAVRHADQERMQRDPHDAAIAGAFLVEHVDGLANPPVEVVDIDRRHVEERHVVELD